MINDACKLYDYVLLDTPPVGTFVDAAIMSRLVDGVVMVVKVGGAKRDEIVAAYNQLEKAEAHVLGVCATLCENSGSEYYYAYYNKDNKRVDPTKHAAPPASNNNARQSVPAPEARRSSTPRKGDVGVSQVKAGRRR